MPEVYEYILSLKDKVSGNLKTITATSEVTQNKFNDLQRKTQTLDASVKDFGSSISSLRQKMELLKAERDLIDPKELTTIRQYNSEIKKLTKDVERLETINGSRFKNWRKEVFAEIPRAAKNPLLLGGAAIGWMGKQAMSFDEGMSKINITAQLDDKSRSELAGQLRQIAKDNKVDIAVAPVGFEKILSQVGNVEQSLPILDAAMKGSKAGFVDLDTVAGALAQTMSIVGQEATAMEVLDTFFASKRVGAGEFADFARYMPSLIAGADNLGIKYKEVAGIFAYMTGKGQSAERAAVLMENMFSVLGRGEIRDKLSLAGIDVFDDTGKIRSTVDIFSDMQRVLGGFNDEQRSSFLEKVGIVDKEAKNAFSVMLGDISKLKRSVDEVSDSAGETDKNLGYARNAAMRWTEALTSLKNIGANVGTIILPIINTGLTILSGILDFVGAMVVGIGDAFSWWWDMLQEGNPLIWGLTAAVGAATAGLLVYETVMNRVKIVTAAKAVADTIATGATRLWTAAQRALNLAFKASPIGWIATGIGVLISLVTWAWQKLEGFRRVIYGVWEGMKLFGRLLTDVILGAVRNLVGGIGSLGSALVKLFKGDFKGAAEEAVRGAKQLFSATPIGIAVDAVGSVRNADWSGAWAQGTAKGTASFEQSQRKRAETSDDTVPEMPEIIVPAVDTDFDALIAKMGGGKKGKQSSGKILDKNSAANLHGTAEYNAIVSRLRPVRIGALQSATPVTTAVAASGISPAGTASAMPAGADDTDYGKSQNWLQTICGYVARIAAMMAMPAAAVAQPSFSAFPERLPAAAEERLADTGYAYCDGRSSGRMEKVCDQIVINIADGNDPEAIKTAVLEAVIEAIDNGA